MRRIRKIDVVGASSYYIGKRIDEKPIDFIKEASDDKIRQYWCLDERGIILVSIEDCPVVVEYEDNENIGEYEFPTYIDEDEFLEENNE